MTSYTIVYWTKSLRILQGQGNGSESSTLQPEIITDISSSPIGLPQAKNFAHFKVLRSNLAMILTNGPNFGRVSGQNFGGAKTYLGPPTQIFGGAMAPLAQWRNDAPGAPATPEGAVIGGRRIVIKMWDNFARLTALLAKVRVWFNNSTIYLDFSAIFSEIAPSKLITKGRH